MSVPTFGGRRPPRTEPLEFELLAYPVNGTGQPVRQRFRARPAANWSTVISTLRSGNGVLDGFNLFFATVLLPEDAPLFRQMVDDPDLYIDGDSLIDAAQWLQEQYAERPTTPPSGSSDGRNPDGLTSEAKPYSPATT